MINILVVDDHPIVRTGLRQILTAAPDMKIQDEAGSGEDALKLLRRRKYDLVILDVALPGIGGLEVLRRIKAGTPAVPVLMLSMYPEEHYAVRTLKLGAAGYLCKEHFPDDLITAIRKILRGGKYLGRYVEDNIELSLRTDDKRLPHETLSPREYQVMCQIASGKTVGEIAKELSLSVKTVNTHREHILRKLELRNNVAIARYAIECRLII
ncbi:MAG: DNA-binding response regulator [Elusimicrobia bacterium RIFOXYA2_FULL_58_8]|nr:MAG: DNA-binding response regulator [Elusimicrobia bacterium RIFOXYA12_FULL_57_11]OGS16136.1 MAG: DNA-binding response regulator [Elusimicrobia bacterium RIFOXYA2_FULL_58_8]